MLDLEPTLLKRKWFRGLFLIESVVWHLFILPCLHPPRCIHTHVYTHPAMSPHPTSLLRSWQKGIVFVFFLLKMTACLATRMLCLGRSTLDGHYLWRSESPKTIPQWERCVIQQANNDVSVKCPACSRKIWTLNEFLSEMLLVSGGCL